MTARRTGSRSGARATQKRASRATRGNPRRASVRRTPDGRRLPFTNEAGTWDLGPDGRLTSWRTAAETAEDLGITTRRLQQLEQKGMPAEGYRGTCRYPSPHAVVWLRIYRIALRNHERVAYLDIEEAFEQHDLLEEELDIDFERELRRDPATRARVRELGLDEWLPLVDAIEADIAAHRKHGTQPGRTVVSELTEETP